MFALPRSSWADYDAKLISEGGGIFLRSAKSHRHHARRCKPRSTSQAEKPWRPTS